MDISQVPESASSVVPSNIGLPTGRDSIQSRAQSFLSFETVRRGSRAVVDGFRLETVPFPFQTPPDDPLTNGGRPRTNLGRTDNYVQRRREEFSPPMPRRGTQIRDRSTSARFSSIPHDRTDSTSEAVRFNSIPLLRTSSTTLRTASVHNNIEGCGTRRNRHYTRNPPVSSFRQLSPPPQIEFNSSILNSNGINRVGSNSARSSDGPVTRSRKRKQNSISPNEDNKTECNFVGISVASSRTRSFVAATSSTRTRSKQARHYDSRKIPPHLRKKPPPRYNADEMDKKPAAVNTSTASGVPVDDCCICMSDIEGKDVAQIDGCDHRFCFSCIEKWSQRENKCPLCKNRFNKIDRVNKQRKKGSKNSLKVKDRDQRSDLLQGTSLEALMESLSRNNSSIASLILNRGGELRFGTVASSLTRSVPRSTSRTNIEADFDDDFSNTPIIQTMRNLQSNHVYSLTVPRPRAGTGSTTTSRSYARNANDATAGNDAQNPLEIEDDDVAEEVIEIDD